jgi:hypothetical protein
MPSSRLVRATTMDNSFLPAGYADMLKSTFSTDLYQQEVLGDFILLGSGQAYKFVASKHLDIKPFDPTRPILFSMDLNVSPLCGIVAQHDEKARTMHVLEEITIKDNAQTRVACRIMADRWKDKAAECWYMCDESGGARSTRTTESDVLIMQSEMPKHFKRNRSLNGAPKPRVLDRVNAANSMLDPAIGPPRLTIDPSCKGLIEDLESVVWESYGKLDKSDPKRTHFTDSASYVLARLFPITTEVPAFGLDGSLQRPVQVKPPQERGFPAPVGG